MQALQSVKILLKILLKIDFTSPCEKFLYFRNWPSFHLNLLISGTENDFYWKYQVLKKRQLYMIHLEQIPPQLSGIYSMQEPQTAK